MQVNGGQMGSPWAIVDTDGRLWVNSITTSVGSNYIFGNKGYAFSQDSSTLATNVMQYPHHEIHDGNYYFVRGFTTLSSGQSINFGVTTPAGSKWAHMHFMIEGTTQTEFYIYERATLSGGGVVTPVNNNRNSTNTSILTLRSNPTISGTTPTSGTLIESDSKGFEGTTPAASKFGGEVDRTDELILKSGTTYLFVIKSVGANNIIDYNGNWYEHTDKVKQW